MVVKTAKSIIKKGYVKTKVKCEGITQIHTLKVEEEKTPFGMVSFLVSEHDLPEMELIRLAKEFGLPIRSGKLKAFPPGKMPKDLVDI